MSLCDVYKWTLIYAVPAYECQGRCQRSNPSKRGDNDVLTTQPVCCPPASKQSLEAPGGLLLNVHIDSGSPLFVWDGGPKRLKRDWLCLKQRWHWQAGGVYVLTHPYHSLTNTFPFQCVLTPSDIENITSRVTTERHVPGQVFNGVLISYIFLSTSVGKRGENLLLVVDGAWRTSSSQPLMFSDETDFISLNWFTKPSACRSGLIVQWKPGGEKEWQAVTAHHRLNKELDWLSLMLEHISSYTHCMLLCVQVGGKIL